MSTPPTPAVIPYKANRPGAVFDAGTEFAERSRIARGIRPIRIREITADDTLTAADETVLANSAGPISLTLPSPSGSFNFRPNILNIGAGTLTVVGTINASVNPTFAQYHGCQLHCDGAVYWKIGGI